MKQQRVAGILTLDNRILLVRKKTCDSTVRRLWFLPICEIDSHENGQEALLRALREMTDAQTDIHWAPPILEGSRTAPALYEGGLADQPRWHTDVRHEWSLFALDALPQEIHIDSLLGLVKYQLSRKEVVDPFGLIDRVFASIFHSYLVPHLDRLRVTADADLYWYIVFSTPFRKFKSVVPFLLSKRSADKAHLFLIPELCFAMWTLLDDCHDETLQRYGVDSAVVTFGQRRSSIALFRALHTIAELLCESLSPSHTAAVLAGLYRSAEVLQLRDQNSFDADLDDYLRQSSDRTEFLRAAWVGVLSEDGCDGTRQRILYDIQRRSAQIGQLINDYFDIGRGGLRDFDRRVTSAVSILLGGLAAPDDHALLGKLWSATEGGKEQYQHLLEKYDIAGVLRGKIRDGLVKMIQDIQERDLETDEKTVLIAWHQMSFVHFYQEIDGVSELVSFVDSIERLLTAR
jgi:hypothetical protein